MQDEDILVDVEELDQRYGERRRKRKLRDLLASMKAKGAIAVDKVTGEAMTPDQLKTRAEKAAQKGKVLEVREIPPISGG